MTTDRPRISTFDIAFLANVKTIYSLEPGSCSWRATKEFLSRLGPAAGHIRHEAQFLTFYEIRDRERTPTSHSLVLVPDLHPVHSELRYREQCVFHWEVHFPLPNPPLYLATAHSPCPPSTHRLACIRELRKLLPERYNHTFPPLEHPLVVENTQAAARCVSDGRADYCITNEHGVATYGLKVDCELRELVICWMCFEFTPD